MIIVPYKNTFLKSQVKKETAKPNLKKDILINTVTT